jgi:hypothetical protein
MTTAILTESGSVYVFSGSDCDCWHDGKIERQFVECKILDCEVGKPLRFSRRKLGLPPTSFGITQTSDIVKIERT